MKARHYVITGIVTYVFFLVANVPAVTAIQLIEDKIPQIKFQFIEGSIWNGTAQRITILSRHVIDDVDWSFCSWRLLLGEACVNMEAIYMDNPVQSQFGISLTGTVKARGLKTELNAKVINELVTLPIGELSGNVAVDIDSLAWDRKSPPSANGVIDWKNAAITVAETAKLGDVSITLSESDNNPINAIILNNGGHLVINGESTIDAEGAYNLELKLTPNNNASKNLRGTLQMFAKKQSDGSFKVNNSGNLKQFGLM